MGNIGHVKASDSSKKLTVPSIEELDTRSMSLQTLHGSQHITNGVRVPHADLLRERSRCSLFSARARIESRRLLGVGIDAVSTTVNRSFNGGARRRSQPKDLEGHRAASHSPGCRLR